MDKLKFRRSGIQARVLALTMFFTLGAELARHRSENGWERADTVEEAVLVIGGSF